MVHITPYNNFYGGLEVKGHAEYANRGNDIVCAAISTLINAVAITIGLEEGKEAFEKLILEDGYSVLIPKSETELSRNMFTMLKHSLTILSTQYPENITIVED